jgi:hypothetical protein
VLAGNHVADGVRGAALGHVLAWRMAAVAPNCAPVSAGHGAKAQNHSLVAADAGWDEEKDGLRIAGAFFLDQSPALAFAAGVAALAGADEALALKNRLVPYAVILQ